MVQKRFENVDIEEFANRNQCKLLYSSTYTYSGGCYGPDWKFRGVKKM